MRARIRKNDTVIVVAGRERGKTGKVLRVIPDKDRAIVETLNMVKRHLRARSAQGTQGIIDKEAAIHISNLMFMCSKCSGPVRLGKKILENGQHIRVCRQCGESIDG